MNQQPYAPLEQRNEAKRSATPLVLAAFLLVGIVVGALLVIAVMKRQPAPRPIAAQVQAPIPATSVVPTVVPPTPAKVEPAKPTETPTKTDPKKPTLAPASAGAKPVTPPLSPFEGIIGISPDHPKGWGGGPPDPKVEAKVAETVDTSVRLVEMLVPEGLKDQVAGFAGGNPITDYRGDTFAPSPGLLIFCPPKATQGILDKISKAGGSPGVEWRGTGPERDQIAIQHAESALQDLQRKRTDLLVRYYEDAIPVRDVDDKIADVKAAMKHYHHKDSANLDAIKVIFLKG